MKKNIAFFVILSVGLFIAGAGIAGVYKWVDENGIVHFSDAPPSHGNSSEKVERVSGHKDGVPTVRYADTESLSSNSTSGKAEKSKTPSVELYVTNWCPYCKVARNFFLSKGIPFKEYDIDKDKDAALRKYKLDKGGAGVPFVVINGRGIRGYSKEAYEEALKQSP